MCFFLNQKTPCVFLDFCWKSKNPRKTQKSKSLGPLRKVLDFWFCIAFGGNQKNPKSKNQKLSEGTETFGFFGFPRFFLFSNRNPNNHIVFFEVLGVKQETQVFFFFVRSLVENQKTLCFLVSVGKQKKPCVVWDFCWKTKNSPRKTKKSKSFGPLRRFWIFGFLVR